MRKSTKTIAIVLTLAMVVAAFCATFTASAEDTNLLAGMSYTAEYNAFQGGYEDAGNQLTDGKYRGDGETDWNDNGAVSGISVEYAGSNAQTIITFEFDAAVDLNSIIVRGVRAFFLDNSVNRHGRLANVGIRLEGEEDYGPAAFEASYEAIEGAPESKTADESATGPQFYNINATLTGVEGITGLKLVFDTYKGDDIGTNAYIFQVDEIEAYGSASPEAPSEAPVVSEEPAESSEEPVVSEEPTESSEEPAVSEEPTESSEEPAESSEAPVESSEAPVESSEAPVESSEEELPVAETTYKVVATEDENGVVTVTASLPAGILSGKIVVTTSDKLTYVDGSLVPVAGGIPNPAYDKDGITGQCVSFAGALAFEEGTVVFTAQYQLAEGETLEDGDILVPYWDMSNGVEFVGTSDMGRTDMTLVPYEEPVETSDETSEETSEAPAETSEAPAETSEAPADSSEAPSGPSTPTGDAGVIAFAVLAVLSGAAVVVLKKRA